MNARAALNMPSLQVDLLELEQRNDSGHSNREWIRAQAAELRGAVENEANPVLRAEYLRRLGLIEGTST